MSLSFLFLLRIVLRLLRLVVDKNVLLVECLLLVFQLVGLLANVVEGLLALITQGIDVLSRLLEEFLKLHQPLRDIHLLQLVIEFVYFAWILGLLYGRYIDNLIGWWWAAEGVCWR